MSRLTENVFKKLLLLSSLLFTAGLCHATDVAYTGTFQGTEGAASSAGAAVSKTYTRDMNITGDRVSMQIVSSTYTVAVSTTFNSNSYVLNTPTITISGFSTGWVPGLAVLYSTGSVAISGLTNQTTYYLSVLSGGGIGGSRTTQPVVFKLASSLANATAGTGIVLASSSTVTNNYTLAPLTFTNTTQGGIQLQWSDDNITYFNATTGNYGAAISSVTFASAGATALWDLGPIQHRYLRLNVMPPTTGAVNYTATDNERYSFKH